MFRGSHDDAREKLLPAKENKTKKYKMSISNQGRNEIRFNNSEGKCLLENWVEEVDN